MRHHTLILTTCLCLLLTGCITARKVNYLQDMQQDSQIELENRFEAVVRPYDELTIQITSSDAELTRPFLWGQNNYNNANNSYGPAYLVDVNGDIDFPVLGKLHVDGLTRLQLQDTITALLHEKKIITDAYVMVRFKNFKIFFLDNKGGQAITIPNERCTFLEALAYAGRLDAYSNRSKIMVLREENGKMTSRFLDPRNSNVMNDPYYMLRQNDFIIMEVANKQTRRTEVAYWTGWISTLLSMTSLLMTIVIYNKIR